MEVSEEEGMGREAGSLPLGRGASQLIRAGRNLEQDRAPAGMRFLNGPVCSLPSTAGGRNALICIVPHVCTLVSYQ